MAQPDSTPSGRQKVEDGVALFAARDELQLVAQALAPTCGVEIVTVLGVKGKAPFKDVAAIVGPGRRKQLAAIIAEEIELIDTRLRTLGLAP